MPVHVLLRAMLVYLNRINVIGWFDEKPRELKASADSSSSRAASSSKGRFS